MQRDPTPSKTNWRGLRGIRRETGALHSEEKDMGCGIEGWKKPNELFAKQKQCSALWSMVTKIGIKMALLKVTGWNRQVEDSLFKPCSDICQGWCVLSWFCLGTVCCEFQVLLGLMLLVMLGGGGEGGTLKLWWFNFLASVCFWLSSTSYF